MVYLFDLFLQIISEIKSEHTPWILSLRFFRWLLIIVIIFISCIEIQYKGSCVFACVCTCVQNPRYLGVRSSPYVSTVFFLKPKVTLGYVHLASNYTPRHLPVVAALQQLASCTVLATRYYLLCVPVHIIIEATGTGYGLETSCYTLDQSSLTDHNYLLWLATGSSNSNNAMKLLFISWLAVYFSR